MPSPVGHVIAGVTAGWLVAGAPLGVHKFWQKEKIRQKVAGTFPGKVPATFETLGWEAAVFGALGACPDIDLLFGAHRGPTHSIGAALVVGFVVGIWTVIRAGGARRPLTFAVACSAAYASHLLLDWLGRDSSPPIGIMAFWPVSRDYFESALHVFMPISRRYYHGATFVMENALAVLRELSILIPLLILVVMFRRRRRGVDPLKWGSAALVIAVVASLGAPAVQAAPADGYPDWIGWYRSGEHEKAVAAVRAHITTRTVPVNLYVWINGRVRAKNSDLLQAALMLHTEAVFESPVWMGQDVQRKLVRRIYEDLTSINPRTPFLKHWTLLWESFHQGQIYLLPAGEPDYLEMTLRAAPQDADLLLAAGSRHEVRWWKAAGNPQRDPAGTASTEESLSKAASLLRQSIAAGPTLMEANLRLARVLLLLGNTDGAAEELRGLQASSADPSIRYLAYLFEGRLHERRDDRSAALAAYQTATGLVPVAQAARLAAARLAYAEGSRGQAARSVTAALEEALSDTDPWWWYVHGQWWHHESYLTTARAMVQDHAEPRERP